eukprot:CAMPEP_0113984296 /NCGR_PEP_ID=MMETSP0328-20130328/5332_1 /TAXON_ID=39455 /ORGANISM="Alexandrium minutum" /LENGTH=38 /assembly_acc=CAM_ASM_000350
MEGFFWAPEPMADATGITIDPFRFTLCMLEMLDRSDRS